MAKKPDPFEMWRREQLYAHTQTAPEHEPLWLLKSIPYNEYLQTAWWKQRRQLYISQHESVFGKACSACGIEDGQIAIANGNESDGIWIRYHLHHLTYERIGEEQDEDLMLVCSPCHNAIHYPDSHAALYWVEYNNDHNPSFREQLERFRPADVR